MGRKRHPRRLDGPRINLDAELPETKLSAALLDFAEPLLDVLAEGAHPGTPTAADMRRALAVAVAVWDGVIEVDLGNPDPLRQLYEYVESIEPGTSPMLDALVSRRRTMFRDDPRLISGYKVNVSLDGKLNVTVDGAFLPGLHRDSS